MRRTFCDRCGAECVNTTGRINGYVEHTTRQGQQVGIDELAASDLCKGCTTAVIEFIGLRLMPRELEKDGPGFSGIMVRNTFEGGSHYMGPADAGTGDDHERAG